MKNIFLISAVVLFFGANLFSQDSKKNIIKTISSYEGYKLIQSNLKNPDFIIIDVRTPGEYKAGHIENAINVDFNNTNFKNNISKLDKNKTYAIYCRTGNRSVQALKVMEKIGFREVYNFGGIANWINEGFKIIK